MFEWTFTLPGLGAVFLAAASALVLLGNAADRIGKMWAAVKKPDQEQTALLENHERRIKDIEAKLVNDNSRLDGLEDGMKVLLRSNLALLRHGIDGNEVAAMRAAEEEVQEYLLKK